MRIKEETITTIYKCEAPDLLFRLSDDIIPLAWYSIIESQGGLPCSGGGTPGSWCVGCHWFAGVEERIESDDFRIEEDDENS